MKLSDEFSVNSARYPNIKFICMDIYVPLAQTQERRVHDWSRPAAEKGGQGVAQAFVAVGYALALHPASRDGWLLKWYCCGS